MPYAQRKQRTLALSTHSTIGPIPLYFPTFTPTMKTTTTTLTTSLSPPSPSSPFPIFCASLYFNNTHVYPTASAEIPTSVLDPRRDRCSNRILSPEMVLSPPHKSPLQRLGGRLRRCLRQLPPNISGENCRPVPSQDREVKEALSYREAKVAVFAR